MVPRAMVAALVPAPLIDTPAPSFSNVSAIELSTVAVTVSVPVDVSCAAANAGSISVAAATSVALNRLFVVTVSRLLREYLVDVGARAARADRFVTRIRASDVGAAKEEASELPEFCRVS